MKRLILIGLIALAAPAWADGWDDCYNYYFGITVKQDFDKAFKACVPNGEPRIQILMYLNGEGTDEDVDKAAEILQHQIDEIKKDGFDPGGSLEKLQDIIGERREHPDEDAPLISFRDIAVSTPDMTLCDSIDDARAQADALRISDYLQTDMPPAVKKALKAVNDTAEELFSRGTDRVYRQYIQGTIRSAMADGYRSTLRDDHDSLVRLWVGKDAALPVPGESLETADKELNEQFQKMLTPPKGLPVDEELVPAFKAEQRAWIKYRNAWVEYAKAVYAVGTKDREAKLDALREALTRKRVIELQSEPGPEGEE